MNEQNVTPKVIVGQYSPLDFLIEDLRHLRKEMIDRDRRRRSAILIGQLAILAGEYRSGKRPRRRDLKRFFYFVAREQREA